MAARTTKPKSSASPRPVTLQRAVAALNRWRDQLNPVRGLTMRRAAALIESYARGEYADLMWTFGAPFSGIEASDPTLAAIMELRLSALLEMDWQAKQVAPEKDDAEKILWPRGFDAALADEQQAVLRESYEGIDNLYDAIEHLGVATFRGFAHVELWENPDGDIHHLEPVEQWNVVRDGSRGAWKYNPEARATSFAALPAEMRLDPAQFIIREVRRPVGRIALTKWIREGLSQKDWDAFIEIYGLPGGIVIMPPNVPPEKEADYEASAADCAKGGSGALPHGSEYKPNDQPRGNNPFKEHLDHLQQQLVLAGTGGMLTMLAESGSGTLAGAAHMETFERIARGEGRRIAELFQRSIDARLIEKHFPGKPALAYFDLCISEETDASKFVEDVSKLSGAGYEVDAEQIEEKTGYKVRMKAEPEKANEENQPAQRKAAMAALRNRAPGPDGAIQGRLMARCREVFGQALAADLQPLRTALAEVLQGDEAGALDRARALYDHLPALAAEIIPAQGSAAALQKILSTAAAEGLAAQTAQPLANRAAFDAAKHPRDPGGEDGGRFIKGGAAGGGAATDFKKDQERQLAFLNAHAKKAGFADAQAMVEKDPAEFAQAARAYRGGHPRPDLNERAVRAKKAHVMVDHEIQRYAEEHNEPAFAKAIGGKSFRDNEPADIFVPGQPPHGIELKTVVKNSNAKITMKGDAIARKKSWARKNKADFHTVVFDDSKVFNARGPGQHDVSQRRILYRRGSGSFRLSSMHEVKDVKELKTLLATPRRKLPAKAR